MRMKIKKLLVIAMVMLLLACEGKRKDETVHDACRIETFENVGEVIKPWYEYRVIAHALGGIDGFDYTNSFEALRYNYNQGTRVFEIDLALTSDEKLVLLHEWSHYHDIFHLGELSGWAPESYATFKSELIYGIYHPLSFDELLDIMEDVPDMYIVLDTKAFELDYHDQIYPLIIEAINEHDPALFERIIPQAYSEETYKVLTDYGLFDDVILTIYSIYASSNGWDISRVIRNYSIKNVTAGMHNDWAKKVIRDIRQYTLEDNKWPFSSYNVYIHTINDIDEAKDIIDVEGFHGIYSDFISETEFREKILNTTDDLP